MQSPCGALLLLMLITSVTALDSSGSFSLPNKLTRRATADADVYETRFDGVSWDNANWQLTTETLDQGHYQARLSVANGYHGINVASLGPFFELDTSVDGDVIGGWPLFDRRQTFATIAGFWDSQPTTNGTNFDWLVSREISTAGCVRADMSSTGAIWLGERYLWHSALGRYHR